MNKLEQALELMRKEAEEQFKTANSIANTIRINERKTIDDCWREATARIKGETLMEAIAELTHILKS